MTDDMPAKFVQIFSTSRSVVALDADGIVWYYQDDRENMINKKKYIAGWYPLATKRFEHGALREMEL